MRETSRSGQPRGKFLQRSQDRLMARRSCVACAVEASASTAVGGRRWDALRAQSPRLRRENRTRGTSLARFPHPNPLCGGRSTLEIDMAKTSKKTRSKVGRAMHKRKSGSLKRGRGGKGGKVK